MKIGIAGAGLSGRLLAWELATRGHAVTVFDPAPGPGQPAASYDGHPGRQPYAAGWTAAGMLSPVAELETGDEDIYALGERSLQRWPEIIGALPQPVFHRQQGSLMLAHRGDDGAARRMTELLAHKLARLGRDAGEAARLIQRIDLAELRRLEPAIQGPTQAWLLPGEGQLHTRQALEALADAASRLGVQWRWGETVARLRPHALLAASGEHAFDWVFDARGLGARPEQALRGEDLSLTPQLRGEDLSFTPQLRGVRGEVLWLHAPGVTLNRPLRLLHPRHRVYIVPRPGDIVFIGASEIESEDRGPVSLRSAVELMAAAHSVIPELAEARVVHLETNLRPALPDNLPRIETAPGLGRVNGLFRHGWLIAPALVERAVQAFERTAATPPASADNTAP
ncbi:MAG: FAD-dependent oxidoreductase [Comamonas sp.]